MIIRNFRMLLLSLLPLFLVAQSNTLVIINSSGQPFFLTANHQKINTSAQCIVKAFDLGSGWITLNIQVPGNPVQVLTDSIVLGSDLKFKDKEFTYALTEEHGKLSLWFKSVSEVSGPVSPPVPEAPKEKGPVIDTNRYGNLYQAKNNKAYFFKNYNTATSSCTLALNDTEIDYAISLLHKNNDEQTKASYVRQIIDDNCYYTGQLIRLLNESPLEIDRLNYAEKAYDHITDKQNARDLLVVFKYETIRKTFSSFITDQENLSKHKQLHCQEAMPASQLETFMNTLKSAGYENEKLMAAKKSLVSVCVSTEQGKKLASLFTHDREKLEFIKFLYTIVMDKEHAEELGDEFQLADTKEEFLNYISH